MPVNVNGNQVQLFSGNSGASFNAELEFDKLVKLEPRWFKNYFHLDAYLFADAGVLSNQFKAGEYGLLADKKVTSNVLVSSGVGAALTIKTLG